MMNDILYFLRKIILINKKKIKKKGLNYFYKIWIQNFVILNSNKYFKKICDSFKYKKKDL